jgi:hypothetical protein
MNAQMMKCRTNLLLTGLGIRKKGFYSPYDHVQASEWDVPSYPHVKDHFDDLQGRFRSFLHEMDANEPHFLEIEREIDGPTFTSRFLSAMDACVVYTGISSYKPRRVLEVGSGNTTHFIMRAIADHNLKTEVTCIDPHPRRDIEELPVHFERRVLEPQDVDRIAELDEGDVLFIDSSHFMQQGFDVDILFNRGFPALKKGVIVHVHDVFLPYGYPSGWEWLRFNEQLALVGWVISGYFETLFATQYVWRDMVDDLRLTCRTLRPDLRGDGGSLWLKKA